MLCPICLGKGWATEEEIKEYPLRCEECHGKGKVSIDWQSYLCGVCGGTGKKELTNQLYIQNCTTEELAEWLCEEAWYGIDEVLWLMEREDIDTKKEAMIRWLKEKKE